MEPQSVSLSKALTGFLSNKRSNSSPESLKELSKFVVWCGQDRHVDDLKPYETAAYGEVISGSAGYQDTTERVQSVKDFLSYCYRNSFTLVPLAKHLRVKKFNKILAPKEKISSRLDMTEEGYQNMLTELENLREQRVSIAKEISTAAADKDFRENAPLDAAREKQGFSEARIRELEDGIQRARLVTTKRGKSNGKFRSRVGLGSKITLVDKSNKETMEYTIVTASEASPLDHKMSVLSPVGKAVVDRTIGDSIEVQTPKGKINYLIKAVT